MEMTNDEYVKGQDIVHISKSFVEDTKEILSDLNCRIDRLNSSRNPNAQKILIDQIVHYFGLIKSDDTLEKINRIIKNA